MSYVPKESYFHLRHNSGFTELKDELGVFISQRTPRCLLLLLHPIVRIIGPPQPPNTGKTRKSSGTYGGKAWVTPVDIEP